ncbi:ferritin-like domain-containing protein [Flagelloscypha sp. PMI_526]|nr:ferritin-like domain-containing protein [Flagelloscypha sp. PMI_526]
MKSFFASLLAISSVFAHPLVERQPAIDDSAILNFALTLEHLENAFYTGALAKFDEKAFTDAGLPPFARKRFVEIGEHEKTHVKFLSDALGDKATKPCTYSFPYTDPKSFAAVSQVLEGVGTSAYAGAAQLISDKNYLTAAATILSTEGRHASWIQAAVNKQAGWSGPFDVPLGLNEVFTLATPFIKSCPDSNPKLPVTAFPNFTFAGTPKPGEKTTAMFSHDAVKTNDLNAGFYTGLDQFYAKVGGDGSVTVPQGLRGTVYAVLTEGGQKGAKVLAGPVVLNFN